jgi:hypothetical protein
VRVIGGTGGDVLIDSRVAAARFFYYADAENEFITASGRAERPELGREQGLEPGARLRRWQRPHHRYGRERRRYGFRWPPHRWSAGAKLMAGLGEGRLAVTAHGPRRITPAADKRNHRAGARLAHSWDSRDGLSNPLRGEEHTCAGSGP